MAFKFNPLTSQLDIVGTGGSGSGVTRVGNTTDKHIPRWLGDNADTIENSDALVQDGGAVEAIAYVSNTTIDKEIVVPDTKVMISSSLDIAPGGVIDLGSGSKLIIV